MVIIPSTNRAQRIVHFADVTNDVTTMPNLQGDDDDDDGCGRCLVASLLSCLYQLKAENRTLEERIATMTARRDRLLAVNARLSVPLASPGSNSHSAADPDAAQPQSLDNGPTDDSGSRHGRSPRSSAAPVTTFASFRVILFSCV